MNGHCVYMKVECSVNVAVAVRQALEKEDVRCLQQLTDDETGTKVFLFLSPTDGSALSSAVEVGATSTCWLESDDCH